MEHQYGMLAVLCMSLSAAAQTAPFEVHVELEETVCHPPAYKVTNNGSGMFWGSGSSQIVRIGNRLFVSAFEHVPGCAPLNNARWALHERGPDGWRLCQRDDSDSRNAILLKQFRAETAPSGPGVDIRELPFCNRDRSDRSEIGRLRCRSYGQNARIGDISLTKTVKGIIH